MGSVGKWGVYALQRLEDVGERIPKLDLQLGFEREEEATPANFRRLLYLMFLQRPGG